ncbi:hypothetical protein, partial [Gordonia sp. NPDC003376]
MTPLLTSTDMSGEPGSRCAPERHSEPPEIGILEHFFDSENATPGLRQTATTPVTEAGCTHDDRADEKRRGEPHDDRADEERSDKTCRDLRKRPRKRNHDNRP